ncbi:ABC transporter substrate-binding protein [Konateibacter massiliensis]|uniref:ABC transporter substrate-binding protein n=1 Tax=Konateibacter massiliensis TaxID=2002841 RepID=UPI000C1612DD|nr:extracellular solute-binding protein [Konateibacter massiliensis]
MKKRLLSVLLAATMAASLMAGCGSQTTTTTDTSAAGVAETESTKESGDKVKLSIYAQYADDDTRIPYDYAVEQLAKEYPNVELELIVQSQDDGMTLSTLAASNNLPDIFQAGTEIINSLRETNQVMILNDVAKETGFEDKVYDSCKELLYADDGNIYAFPYAGQEYVLWYYNKAIFKACGLEVPKTYEELLKCIEVFNSSGITPMSMFGQEGWVTTAMYDAIATRYTAGGIKDLDEGKAQITDQAYVDAANTMSQLVNAGMFSADVSNTNYDQASALFLERGAAMFLNGQWYIEDATKALGEDVGWMYYPAPDEASYEAGKTVFAGGGSTSGYAVNPDSENAELAAEVAAFISEKYCEAKVLYRSNPLVAVDTGVTAETELTPMMQELSDVIPTITSTTKFTWGLTNSIFNTGIMDQTKFLLSTQYTADEFVEEMDSVIKRMND